MKLWKMTESNHHLIVSRKLLKVKGAMEIYDETRLSFSE